MSGSGKGLGISHRSSGMEQGTSQMSGIELGISHRSSGLELGTSRRSGKELHISHRSSSGTELGISHSFELDPEVDISRRFESDMDLGISQRFELDMEVGNLQKYIWYSAQPPIPNLSHKMEGIVSVSAGHTSFCGFANSEKKVLIRSKKASKETCSFPFG